MTLSDAQISRASAAPISVVTSWLLLGCAELSPPGLSLEPEPSPPVQFHAIFASLPPASQQIWKSALAAAITEWKQNQHGLVSMEGLLRCVAYFQASSVLSVIQKLLTTKPLLFDDLDLRGTLVGVVAGLSPAPGSEEILRILFADSRYHSRHGAQIMIGLSLCEPRDTAAFLSDFLHDIFATHSRNYNLNRVVTELLRVISPAIFVPQLARLRAGDHRTICELMTAGQDPVGQWKYRDDQHLFVVRRPARMAPIRYSPPTPLFTNDLCLLAERELSATIRQFEAP